MELLQHGPHASGSICTLLCRLSFQGANRNLGELSQHQGACREIIVHNQEAQCVCPALLLRNSFLFHPIHPRRLYVLDFAKPYFSFINRVLSHLKFHVPYQLTTLAQGPSATGSPLQVNQVSSSSLL